MPRKGLVAYAGVSTQKINPSVAKVGGLQSQGAKGKAVVCYCEPLATPDLEFSGFPRCFKGKKDG